MQFSRGCPYRCEFCDIIVMFGRKPRTKAPEQVGQELDLLRAEIPRDREGKGLKEFSDHLLACKQRYPKSETMLLVPDASIEYQEVIAAMDSGRWVEEEQEGTKVRYDLFPNVVISGML